MASKLIIRNGTVVVGDSAATVLRGQDVLIIDDRIAEVGPQLSVDDVTDVIDAEGAVVMPGLIDSHMHMWQHPWRETVSRLWGFEDYAKVFWPIRERYEPQDTHDATLGCALDMIDRGVTGVIDYFHGANSTPAHADAALAAHRSSGQRVQFTYGATTAYDRGDEEFEKGRQARLADFDRVRAASATSGDDLITVGLGLLTPSEKIFDRFFEELEHGRTAGSQMSFHQNRPGEIRRIHERGLLGADVVPVHANTISDRELRWMAEAGMVISTTPQSEVSLGWSISVMRRALQAGVGLSFGVDTPGSLPVDVLSQVRLAHSILQLLDADAMRDGARTPINRADDPPSASFDDVLRMCSSGGARAMGLGNQLGEIRPGALADVIVVRPADAAATEWDPVAHVVLACATPSEVEAVVIGGGVRKRDGELVGVDRTELAETNLQVRQRVLSRAGI